MLSNSSVLIDNSELEVKIVNVQGHIVCSLQD